jgi:hypothetical protein
MHQSRNAPSLRRGGTEWRLLAPIVSSSRWQRRSCSYRYDHGPNRESMGFFSVSLQHLAQVGPIIEFDPHAAMGSFRFASRSFPAPEPGIVMAITSAILSASASRLSASTRCGGHGTRSHFGPLQGYLSPSHWTVRDRAGLRFSQVTREVEVMHKPTLFPKLGDC